MEYFVTCNSENGSCEITENQIIFTAKGCWEQAFFTLDFTIPTWGEDCYIMMPACVYNGNRIKRVVREYPPRYREEECGVDAEPLMTDVPAFNMDGSGVIQVTTGDMATPCFGIWSRSEKKAFFLFTEQEIKGKNLGYTVEKGKLQISYPSNRSDLYRFCKPHETSGDKGVPVRNGEVILSEYSIHCLDCPDMAAFYESYFQLRKCLLKAPRAEFMYTRELWELMEHHFNSVLWSGEYYAEISHLWKPGWIGGGMSTLSLLKYGTSLSRERAVKTLDYMTNYQAPSGFFYGRVKDGKVIEKHHLTRQSADALYFLFKQFAIYSPKPEWVESARRCADAFVKMFAEYGTFGQLVDTQTGKMIFARSTSAVMACGALAKAWEYFGDERYLDTARESLDYYMESFLENGLTNGGPGDMLSAPDSESAYALVESCIALYEVDQADKWLTYAKTAVAHFSSWVVSYAYRFPEGSEFHRLGINTVGSVFANVQNKHSAPGICTLSGDSLLKLYRYTKDPAYLELIKDIAYFIPQCVSTEERPIYSWDTPPRKLPAGYICERVNMSDWEGFDKVGGLFCGTCWCETSLLLSFAELMTCEEIAKNI